MTDTARLRELAGKLLPCPFCGGEMQLRYALWPSEGDRDAVIHNVPGGTSCPIEGAFSIDTFDNGVSVAEAWNRRPLLDELDASKARIAEVEGAGTKADRLARAYTAASESLGSDEMTGAVWGAVQNAIEAYHSAGERGSVPGPEHATANATATPATAPPHGDAK